MYNSLAMNFQRSSKLWRFLSEDPSSSSSLVHFQMQKNLQSFEKLENLRIFEIFAKFAIIEYLWRILELTRNLRICVWSNFNLHCNTVAQPLRKCCTDFIKMLGRKYFGFTSEMCWNYLNLHRSSNILGKYKERWVNQCWHSLL